MPENMKQIHTPQPAPAVKAVEAVVEPAVEPQATDTAVLEGDGIEVVYDWAHLATLSNGTSLLLDKDNRDVRKSMPEWHFAWFTARDADHWEMYGYKKVHLVFGDKVRAAIQTKEKREKANGRIEYLTGDDVEMAYCIETKKYDSYNAYIQKTQVISTEALKSQAEGVFRDHGGEFKDAVVDTPGEGIGERKISG